VKTRRRDRAAQRAGYGEFDPIDSNETAGGKSRNRRTEITLQPNIDEIVAVPQGGPTLARTIESCRSLSPGLSASQAPRPAAQGGFCDWSSTGF
jgi:hypothetical protein